MALPDIQGESPECYQGLLVVEDIFNRDSPRYSADRIVPDQVLELYLNLSRGTISVKRCRGTWMIPTVRVGRKSFSRVGDVMAAFIDARDASYDSDKGVGGKCA